jgi:hypothetical protein
VTTFRYSRRFWKIFLGSMLWSQFEAIFGEQMAFFSKTKVMINCLQNLHIFAKFLGES